MVNEDKGKMRLNDWQNWNVKDIVFDISVLKILRCSLSFVTNRAKERESLRLGSFFTLPVKAKSVFLGFIWILC